VFLPPEGSNPSSSDNFFGESSSSTVTHQQPLMYVPSPPHNVRSGQFRQFDHQQQQNPNGNATNTGFGADTFGATLQHQNNYGAMRQETMADLQNESYCSSNNSVYGSYSYQQRCVVYCRVVEFRDFPMPFLEWITTWWRHPIIDQTVSTGRQLRAWPKICDICAANIIKMTTENWWRHQEMGLLVLARMVVSRGSCRPRSRWC